MFSIQRGLITIKQKLNNPSHSKLRLWETCVGNNVYVSTTVPSYKETQAFNQDTTKQRFVDHNLLTTIWRYLSMSWPARGSKYRRHKTQHCCFTGRLSFFVINHRLNRSNKLTLIVISAPWAPLGSGCLSEFLRPVSRGSQLIRTWGEPPLHRQTGGETSDVPRWGFQQRLRPTVASQNHQILDSCSPFSKNKGDKHSSLKGSYIETLNYQ